jgi:hypothetical protein
MDLSAPIAWAGAVVACFLGYLYYRLEVQKRDQGHAERLKALETGRSLPDPELAWAGAEVNRCWAAAIVGFGVPAIMAAAALGGTLLVLRQEEPTRLQLPLLCVIWGVCGLVSLVAAATSLGVLCRQRPGAAASSTEDCLPPSLRRTPVADESSALAR